jgi:hypothetical protein
MVGYSLFKIEGGKMGIAWSENELRVLQTLVNTFPIEMITAKINRFHCQNLTGIERTKTAVKARIRKMGYSRLATEDNMSAREWSRSLGLNVYRVQGWIRKQGLGYRRGCNYLIISRNNMIAFAKRKPELLAGVSEDILLYYFAESLTNIILSKKAKCPDFMPIRKILRVDNNTIYPSLHEAERQLGMSRRSIKNEAKRGGWLRFA